MSARGKAVPLVSLHRIVMLASRLEVHQRSMVVYLVMLVCLRTKFLKLSSKLSAYAVRAHSRVRAGTTPTGLATRAQNARMWK